LHKKIALSYQFVSPGPGQSASPGQGTAPARAGVHHPLPELLAVLQQLGSIAAVARRMQLSYRHVWGQLKHWEQAMGQELVVWDKGRAAQLTPFGVKLLWAERQAQARLGPQIEALQADLERALALVYDPQVQVLTLYASHDEALPVLRAHAAAQQELHLDTRFMGSVDAITALNQGRCTLAGFHVRTPAPAAGSLTARTYKPLLKPGRHKLLGFAQRMQGLMVAPGNPLGVQSVLDVAQRRARFVNRPQGTGTRVLLAELLQAAGLDASALVGADAHCEPSHAAVAAAVASGQADVGLGIESAARQQGLDFVPLLREDYHLVCLAQALDTPPLQALLGVLRTAQWQQALNALPGYRAHRSGEVLALKRLLPWWTFRPARGVRASGGVVVQALPGSSVPG
jgi:putative molybdopterin biosynthesis protein